LGLAFIKHGALDRGIQELGFTLRLNPEDERAREALSSALLLKDIRRD
jgi:hypothetical protein